jgi:hypothetical protein
VCKAVTSAVGDYVQAEGAYDTEASAVAVQCKRVHDGKTKFLDIRGGSTLGAVEGERVWKGRLQNQ